MADRDESKDILLSGALRKAVAQTFANDRDTVTLRLIRTIVEQQHNLGQDYFKTDPYWKERSKEIIMEEVDIQTANHPEPDLSSSSPPVPVKTSKATTSVKKAVIKAPKSQPKPALKKKAPAARKTASNARRKAVSSSDDEDEDEDESEEDQPEDDDEEDEFEEEEKPKGKSKAKATKPKAKPTAKPKEKPQPRAKANGIKEKEAVDVEMANAADKDDDDDSVLSDLPSGVEEEVVPKKRGRPKKTEEPSNKRVKTVISPKEKKTVSPKVTAKATKAAAKDTSPESPKASSPVVASPKKAKASAKRTIADDSEDEDAAEDESPKDKPKAKDTPNSNDKTSESEERPIAEVITQEESEMSELIDEEPTRKKRGRKPNPDGASKAKKTKTIATKAKATKVATKGGKELTADEEKIKSLQSWLVKCGIRKVWGRELSKYETSSEKISHLKSLLSDAGMTGQYSLAKAKKIKEDRELAAEVEAVQKGAAVWGESDDDGATRTRTSRSGAAGGNGGGGTGRRLVQKSKGFEGLDFLDDQSDDSD